MWDLGGGAEERRRKEWEEKLEEQPQAAALLSLLFFFWGPFWWSRLFLLPSLSESGGVYPSSLKWGSGAAEGEEQRKREIQIPQ